ncbi:hypothetical protein K440DRAFT_614431 [Wilcoxina mikolae CBS 423.85]|nr:hypothetical protein K440DRAFT_614431 [Wilcoxina mikolae CBS 423.85]
MKPSKKLNTGYRRRTSDIPPPTTPEPQSLNANESQHCYVLIIDASAQLAGNVTEFFFGNWFYGNTSGGGGGGGEECQDNVG